MDEATLLLCEQWQHECIQRLNWGLPAPIDHQHPVALLSREGPPSLLVVGIGPSLLSPPPRTRTGNRTGGGGYDDTGAAFCGNGARAASNRIIGPNRRPIHHFSIVTPDLSEHREQVKRLLSCRAHRRQRISSASSVKRESATGEGHIPPSGTAPSIGRRNKVKQPPPPTFQGERSVLHRFRQKDQWDRLTLRTNRQFLVQRSRESNPVFSGNTTNHTAP